MASYTGYLPTFMGINAWTVKTAGLHFAHSNPDDTWAVFLASNGPVKATAVKDGEAYRVLYVSDVQNCSGYIWTGFGKESYNLSSIHGSTYYALGRQIITVFTGIPFVGMFDTLDEALNAYAPTPPAPDDPYSPGGIAGPGGGDGTFTIITDPVPFPTLPTISVADAGFVSIWVPNLSQLQDLANFMWNADPTKIDFWKKLIANPMELILGLHLLPFRVPTETLPASVTMGFIDTGIEMYYTDQQFHEIDCGTLDVEEFWGAFLDYAPYTQLDIYLPFIGVRSLNVNDCMPKTIALKYIVDIVTGSCVAILRCDDAVFYHFSGNCASEVPVTASQMQEIVKAAFSLVTTVASAAATGGVAGALTAGAVGASSAIANTGQHASRSGTIGGTTGFMSVQTPYLILTRPRQAMPEDQTEYTGYPAFITMGMDELEGYTEIEVTHLHGMSCTSTECDEIIRLLSEGVIF